MSELWNHEPGGRPRLLLGLGLAALLITAGGLSQPARGEHHSGADARTTLVIGMVTNNPKNNYT